MQKRILFFVFDGKSGLGHLRRMSRIAAEVQGPCASLVVTGMRDASWIVPDNCEVLLLPSWNSVRADRSSYWDRDVWLRISRADALAMRRAFLASVFRIFDPDAVLVDYLPFGHAEELSEALHGTRALKYFVLRGIIDSSDRSQLCGKATDRIGNTFDHILVTADSQIVDIAREYSYGTATARKIRYVGYVAPKAVDMQEVRQQRGVGRTDPWVVCSSGGGVNAEQFLRSCVNVASSMPDVQFDVVFGPLSNLTRAVPTNGPSNCRIVRECRSLADFHASCDVVVTGGGYNSLIEAAIGGARIIVHPSRVGDDDEQRINARRLSKHYPISLLATADSLQSELALAIQEARLSARPHLPLNVDGAVNAARILFGDLGLEVH